MISEEYKKTQEELHGTGNYGVVGKQYAPIVSEIMNKLEVPHLLDYGCGSNLSLFNSLKVTHKFKYQAYDPCVEKFSTPPVPATMVACVDVLEHIEPEYIEDVLDHLEHLTEVVGFFSIHTGPAGKTLSDGRNAHLIQKPMEWWLPQIWERWDIQTVQRMGIGFYVIVYARPKMIHEVGATYAGLEATEG